MAVFKWLLRTIIAGIYIVAGSVKLVPTISGDVHQHMSHEFIEFAKVFPLERFGYPIKPEQYMQLTGIIEIVCGSLLITGPRSLRSLSSFLLMITMAVALHSLHELHRPQEQYIPASVCLVLLLLERICSRSSRDDSKQKTQ